MLSGELAIFLIGRYIEKHMLLFSFKEYYLAVSNSNELREYQNYIENGFFPYLINLGDDKNLIRGYLDGIYNTVLFKDVVSRINIKDVRILDSLASFLFDNIET